MDTRRAAIFIILCLILLSGCTGSENAEPLPQLWPAPEFRLVNFDGREVSNEDLRGKVWVGAFIFTRCPGPCPLINQRMKEVQSQLGPEEIRLVSFTVDPEFDTPAVMKTYSHQWSENADNWFFLTSSRPEDMGRVAEGFKIAASRGALDDSGVPDIVHGTHIFVVDQTGVVRALVGSSSPDASHQVVRIVRRLNQDPGRQAEEAAQRRKQDVGTRIPGLSGNDIQAGSSRSSRIHSGDYREG